MIDTPPSLIIVLPSPPSLNALWANVPGGRRVKTQKYRDWIIVAGWEAKRQFVGKPQIICRYDMDLEVPISWRDTPNWEKAIGDLLETVGIVSNDGNVNDFSIKPKSRSDCLVRLTLRPDLGAIRPPAKPRLVKSKQPKRLPGRQ